MSEGVQCLSSDHSLHRCGQSLVQATTLLLVMQIVFWLMPTFGRAFCHQELPVVSLYKGTTASTARRHTGWKTLDVISCY